MRRTLAAAILACVLTAVLSLGSVAAANADVPPIVFDPKTTTAEYGQSWAVEGTVSPSPFASWSTPTAIVAMRGTPNGYTPNAQAYHDPSTNTMRATVYSSYTARPLNAGTYNFDMVVTNGYGGAGAGTSRPQPLVIEPAALSIETRVVEDAADPSSAIVSARFVGKFVDNFQTTQFPTAPFTPAGEWQISIVDSTGETTSWKVARTDTDDVLATSLLWAESKPGEQYTATAEFVTSGTSSNNFSISGSAPFSYTAPTSERQFAPATAPSAPEIEPAAPATFSVPLWWIVLAGVLVAALAAVLVILAVRLRRTPARSQKLVPAHE